MLLKLKQQYSYVDLVDRNRIWNNILFKVTQCSTKNIENQFLSLKLGKNIKA